MSGFGFFNKHRTWEDWFGMLLGVLIVVSPWFPFSSHDVMDAERSTMILNTFVVGMLVFGVAQLEYVALQRWEEIGEIALGLWLLHRSHTDLGANWSNELDVREGHTLVTSGIYGRVRHPMYLALLTHAAGQALVIPNWVAGPAFLVAFALLVAIRLGREERMMLDTFDGEYAAYMSRTRRILPGLW